MKIIQLLGHNKLDCYSVLHKPNFRNDVETQRDSLKRRLSVVIAVFLGSRLRTYQLIVIMKAFWSFFTLSLAISVMLINVRPWLDIREFSPFNVCISAFSGKQFGVAKRSYYSEDIKSVPCHHQILLYFSLNNINMRIAQKATLHKFMPLCLERVNIQLAFQFSDIFA